MTLFFYKTVQLTGILNQYFRSGIRFQRSKTGHMFVQKKIYQSRPFYKEKSYEKYFIHAKTVQTSSFFLYEQICPVFDLEIEIQYWIYFGQKTTTSLDRFGMNKKLFITLSFIQRSSLLEFNFGIRNSRFGRHFVTSTTKWPPNFEFSVSWTVL